MSGIDGTAGRRARTLVRHGSFAASVLVALAGRAAAAQVTTRAPAPRVADVRPTGAPPRAVQIVPVDAFTVIVTWEYAPWTGAYAIERAASAAGPWEVVWGRTTSQPRVAGIVTTTSTPVPAPNPVGTRASRIDTTALAPSMSYLYRALAIYADSAPGVSATVAVATPALPAVRALSTRFALEGKGVRLEWGAPITPTSRLAAYEVYRDGKLLASPTAPLVAGGAAQPLSMYTDTTLASGTSAKYAVRAVYRLNDGSAVAGPVAEVVGKANGWIVRTWCPPKVIATVTYVNATQVVVRAVDAYSRAPLQGTVLLEGASTPATASYALGAAFTPPPCTPTSTGSATAGNIVRDAKNGVEAAGTDAVGCGATVAVAGYPAASVKFTPPPRTR